jgi:hypothetical protein
MGWESTNERGSDYIFNINSQNNLQAWNFSVAKKKEEFQKSFQIPSTIAPIGSIFFRIPPL